MSWASDKAREWWKRWDLDASYRGTGEETVANAIREAIEEAARRVRARESVSLSIVGHGHDAEDQREACALAIESMLAEPQEEGT